MSSELWEKIQQKLLNGVGKSVKQISYLVSELKQDPKGGFQWWMRNKYQYADINQALDELRSKIDQPDFEFSLVYKLFTNFNFRDEDLSHAEWYQQAHLKIKNLQKILTVDNVSSPSTFRPVLTELKFIIEADEFHERWTLNILQKKVARMYHQLLDQVEDLKQTKRDSRILEKKKLLVEEKKLELEKIKKQKEIIALQKEKAELLKAKVVEEKLLKEAKKQELIEAQNLLSLENEKKAKIAAVKRQQELDDSLKNIAGEWDKQVTKHSD